MDALPEELIDDISSFLDYDDPENTLTVSVKFEIAAESCSRALEKYILTDDHTASFLTIYGGRRIRYPRRIEGALGRRSR